MAPALAVHRRFRRRADAGPASGIGASSPADVTKPPKTIGQDVDLGAVRAAVAAEIAEIASSGDVGRAPR